LLARLQESGRPVPLKEPMASKPSRAGEASSGLACFRPADDRSGLNHGVALGVTQGNSGNRSCNPLTSLLRGCVTPEAFTPSLEAPLRCLPSCQRAAFDHAVADRSRPLSEGHPSF